MDPTDQPTPDNARQELERAATEILSDLTHAGDLPSAWTYQRVHALVAIAYGKGYAAGAQYAIRMLDQADERIAQALDQLR